VVRTYASFSYQAGSWEKKRRVMAYNLANFIRTLALPEAIKQWWLTSLKKKLIKIGARIVTHGRYVTFQTYVVAIPRMLFAEILRQIAELLPQPQQASA